MYFLFDLGHYMALDLDPNKQDSRNTDPKQSDTCPPYWQTLYITYLNLYFPVMQMNVLYC